MEIVALIIGLMVLVVGASWLRSRAIASQIDRQRAESAESALDTTRRIHDATRPPPDTDDARDWLRDFGENASSRER